jgi:hypothetical protein
MAEWPTNQMERVVRAAIAFNKAATVTPDMCWSPVSEITDEGGRVDEMPCGRCEPCTLADLRDAVGDLEDA